MSNETTFSRIKSDPVYAETLKAALSLFLKDDYHSDMEKAQVAIRKHEEMVTLRHQQGIIESKEIDISSMQLATFLCRLLLRYFKPKYGGLKVSANIPGPIRDTYEAVSLKYCKYVLVSILMQFVRLSGVVRGKYRELLGPELMRWESFQRMIWVLNPRDDNGIHELKFSIAIGSANSAETRQAIQDFLEEYLATQHTMEAVVYGIIEHDVKKLQQLALTIKLDLESHLPDDYQYQTTNLMALSAASKRYGDLLAIKELGELLMNDSIVSETITNTREKTNKIYGKKEKRIEKRYETTEMISLDSIFDRQSALQLLVKVGEKITGKHLSLQIKQWDPTTDWQAFITIRDAIIHADEAGNYRVIQGLMQNTSRFRKIMQELPLLHERVTRLVVSRHNALPQYHEDHERFWNDIYQFELQLHVGSMATSVTVDRMERESVSDEDRLFFITELRKAGRSQEVIDKWNQIFDKKISLPEDGREYGRLLSADLPPKGGVKTEERKVFNRCKKLAASLRKPKCSEESRQAQREDRLRLAAQRKLRQEQAFEGFVDIRELAREFSDAQGEHMSLCDAVLDCIAVVKNVYALVDQFVDSELMHHLERDFKLEQLGDEKKPLIEGLMKEFKENSVFRRSLEYNLSVSLLHLSRLESRLHIEPGSDFAKLWQINREFRNYVVHGDLSVDMEPQGDGKPFVSSCRDWLIPLYGLGFISRLMPHLERYRDQLVLVPRATVTNIECLSSSRKTGLLGVLAILFMRNGFSNPSVNNNSMTGYFSDIWHDLRYQLSSAQAVAQKSPPPLSQTP